MLHVIVGNTGAGKTTYAQQLKTKIGAVIFSIDEWNATLFLADKQDVDGLPWFLERIERAETLIMSLIKQLNALDTDVVLDLGFSKFEHREKFRNFARLNGYKLKLHFIDVCMSKRYKNIQKRNTEKGETFAFKVSKSDFNFMETWFEKPNEEELKNAIIVNEF